MKFLEIVGKASTTASLNDRRLGHNVNAAAYRGDGKIILKLESNGSPVRGVKPITMTEVEYEKFLSAST